VTGYGKALPIAPNDTGDGREKNRRFEVWLR
jgi:outer membrane protein OmpA-like peptidoglycan-associated protein